MFSQENLSPGVKVKEYENLPKSIHTLSLYKHFGLDVDEIKHIKTETSKVVSAALAAFMTGGKEKRAAVFKCLDQHSDPETFLVFVDHNPQFQYPTEFLVLLRDYAKQKLIKKVSNIVENQGEKSTEEILALCFESEFENAIGREIIYQDQEYNNGGIEAPLYFSILSRVGQKVSRRQFSEIMKSVIEKKAETARFYDMGALFFSKSNLKSSPAEKSAQTRSLGYAMLQRDTGVFDFTGTLRHVDYKFQWLNFLKHHQNLLANPENPEEDTDLVQLLKWFWNGDLPDYIQVRIDKQRRKASSQSKSPSVDPQEQTSRRINEVLSESESYTVKDLVDDLIDKSMKVFVLKDIFSAAEALKEAQRALEHGNINPYPIVEEMLRKKVLSPINKIIPHLPVEPFSTKDPELEIDLDMSIHAWEILTTEIAYAFSANYKSILTPHNYIDEQGESQYGVNEKAYKELLKMRPFGEILARQKREQDAKYARENGTKYIERMLPDIAQTAEGAHLMNMQTQRLNDDLYKEIKNLPLQTLLHNPGYILLLQGKGRLERDLKNAKFRKFIFHALSYFVIAGVSGNRYFSQILTGDLMHGIWKQYLHENRKLWHKNLSFQSSIIRFWNGEENLPASLIPVESKRTQKSNKVSTSGHKNAEQKAAAEREKAEAARRAKEARKKAEAKRKAAEAAKNKWDAPTIDRTKLKNNLEYWNRDKVPHLDINVPKGCRALVVCGNKTFQISSEGTIPEAIKDHLQAGAQNTLQFCFENGTGARSEAVIIKFWLKKPIVIDPRNRANVRSTTKNTTKKVVAITKTVTPNAARQAKSVPGEMLALIIDDNGSHDYREFIDDPQVIEGIVYFRIKPELLELDDDLNLPKDALFQFDLAQKKLISPAQIEPELNRIFWKLFKSQESWIDPEFKIIKKTFKASIDRFSRYSLDREVTETSWYQDFNGEKTYWWVHFNKIGPKMLGGKIENLAKSIPGLTLFVENSGQVFPTLKATFGSETAVLRFDNKGLLIEDPAWSKKTSLLARGIFAKLALILAKQKGFPGFATRKKEEARMASLLKSAHKKLKERKTNPKDIRIPVRDESNTLAGRKFKATNLVSNADELLIRDSSVKFNGKGNQKFSTEEYTLVRHSLNHPRNRKHLALRLAATFQGQSVRGRQPVKSLAVKTLTQKLNNEIPALDLSEGSTEGSSESLLRETLTINNNHWIDEVIDRLEDSQFPLLYQPAITATIDEIEAVGGDLELPD